MVVRDLSKLENQWQGSQGQLEASCYFGEHPWFGVATDPPRGCCSHLQKA